MPIAKLTPDNPNPKLYRANSRKLSAKESRYIGTAHRKNNAPQTGFQPNLSVSMPAGRRKIEPVRTGIPINQPISTGPQSNT